MVAQFSTGILAHFSISIYIVTDFQDLETPDDVVDIFFNANHTSGDVFKSNTIMTCNWLLGRQREESVGEEENLYIPHLLHLPEKYTTP